MNRLFLSDQAEPYPAPGQWQAKWIWCPSANSGEHNFVYFRFEFSLAETAGQAFLYLAAEREATCWINDKIVGYGPPISDPRFKRYQTYMVTDFLKPGNNCIALRCYHDSGRAAMTAHAETCGVLCQLDIEGRNVAATDEKWKAWHSSAYLKPSGLPLGDSMWPEFYNAEADPIGWRKAGFQDKEWTFAIPCIKKQAPLWGAPQPQARFFPWVNLIPSETRPLKRTKHYPVRIFKTGEVLQRREASPHDTAIRMSLEKISPFSKATCKQVENLCSGDGVTIVRNSSPQESYDTFDGLQNVSVILDFGQLINARPGFELEAEGGQIDIGYAYKLEEGRVVPYVSRRTAMADHYIMRPGPQSWQTHDWRHFRYMQLTFRNLIGEVKIKGVWAEHVENHFVQRGQVTADDRSVAKAFDIVRRTTTLNVVDRTMDNASRERRQYLGDCSGILPSIWNNYGDSALIRRYFAQAREGQHATGHYRYSYPGHDDDRQSLFDHSLSLPLRLYEHYQLFGDLTLVESMWDSVQKFMTLVESCLDDRGRMKLPPYNIWFDWAHMQRAEFFLPLQAMTAEVFHRVGYLADELGLHPGRWQQSAERTKAAITDWYDDKRGVFVDAVIDGQRQTHISEQGLSLVALWELALPEKIHNALDYWDRHQEEFGQASPAWHYLPAAFFHQGRTDLGLRWIHQRLDNLDRQDLDTWPETWCLYGERTTGSWRCRNSRSVAQGAGLGIPTAFLQELCGIKPGDPGFKNVMFAPNPGNLKYLKGVQPGPDGDFTMEYTKSDEMITYRLLVPDGRPVKLILNQIEKPSSISINGSKKEISESIIRPSGQPGWLTEMKGKSSYSVTCPLQ